MKSVRTSGTIMTAARRIGRTAGIMLFLGAAVAACSDNEVTGSTVSRVNGNVRILPVQSRFFASTFARVTVENIGNDELRMGACASALQRRVFTVWVSISGPQACDAVLFGIRPGVLRESVYLIPDNAGTGLYRLVISLRDTEGFHLTPRYSASFEVVNAPSPSAAITTN